MVEAAREATRSSAKGPLLRVMNRRTVRGMAGVTPVPSWGGRECLPAASESMDPKRCRGCSMDSSRWLEVAHNSAEKGNY